MTVPEARTCDAGPVWDSIITLLTRFLDVIRIPIVTGACAGYFGSRPDHAVVRWF